jgi:GT2 family glycosyltransferase
LVGSATTSSDGLDVVIVAYRSRELLRRCLESLRDHPPSAPMRVIVVDNDSRDGTSEMLASAFPEVELIESPTNLGFAAATNLGAARGKAPYLLALNPDTEVTPHALDTVLATMRTHDDVAVVGPRLVREDGSLDHASKRSFPTPLSALGHFTGAARRRRVRGELAAYRAPDVQSGPVDAVNGAFMLMRRDVFERLGGFDEGYWMYMEDLDLSYRLARAGWLSWYEPEVTVKHVKGGTVEGERSPRLVWHFHLGMYRFYRAHYAPDRSWPVNLVVYAGIGIKFAVSAAHSVLRRIPARRRQRLRSVVPSDGASGNAEAG